MKNFIKENKLILIGLCVATIIVCAGFNTKMYKVAACTSTVTKYVTAEYSEMTSGIDMDGDLYTETDYWSEPASEVYSIKKYNELPEYPPMPEHNTSMKRDFHFDNFQFHTDTKVEVAASSPGDTTMFTVGISKAAHCISKLESDVEVDTWYTITYNSDFK